MTQHTHTFVHSPDGLKMIQRQTIVPKGKGNSYRPPQQQQASRQRARRTKAPTDYDNVLVDEEAIDEEDIDGNGDVWPLQIPKSQRYYPQPGQYDQGDIRVNVRRRKQQLVIPPRRSRKADEEEEDQDFEEPETQRPRRTRQRVKVHWLVFVGIALLLMIGGWIAFNDLGVWWQTHQDDVTFGMPRTYQIDAVVGHNDSSSNPSHFIALNLRGSIYILEAPGGNFSKSRSYFITTEVGGNPNPPVTIKFQDLTHSGHLDMVVTIGDPPTPLIVFLFNNGSQFLAKS